ncbi:BTAD domain-containing putative transcriptional regulator [Nocardia sp. NPDC058058]|uniref:BTAD domain-containing putative transcriptional regulator n=1 Tax=Nocardia sp. NPDC058058 TaxID=3346317 RepID=UPI0036DE085A
MTGPEIRVLGPLRLTLGGERIPLGTPMQRAVLGRLIVARGQAVPAERLVDDLWAGVPPPKAASVLQVHIHNLRRLFEPDRARRAPSRYIVSESSGYALKIAENAVDAWQFEQQLRTYQELISNPETRPAPGERNALLETVLAQWHGPALEAFADFEWAAAEADRLTDLRLTAVELNAQAKLELGRAGEVVIELRALFDEHPGREELVRLLATAQYQQGQQLEALTTIRRSREFLSDEFGVDPGPGLRHLETAILTHAAELTVPGGLLTVAEAAEPHPAAVGYFPETPSATGYSAELSELLTLSESARAGRLRLAWISGEAGIGKTTLAESALSALTATGWIAATGNCPEIDGAPMGWAWTEIGATLDSAAAQQFPGGSDFARVGVIGDGHVDKAGSTGAMPDSTVGGADQAGTPDDDHSGATGLTETPRNGGKSGNGQPGVVLPGEAEDAFTLSRRLAQSCRQAAGFGPVVLLLENVHRADAATLQVLRQVVHWLRDEPVLVIVTARRSEAGPQVRDTAAALARSTAVHMELNGLDQAGTRQVAEASGLTPLGPETLAQLHGRTGGNPLFVRELAKLLAAHGSIEQVPESIREIVGNRIARLPAGVTEVLQHISIWGSGMELGLLSRASGLGQDALIDLLAAAEAAGLVSTDSTGGIRFVHALIRDAVYLGIPPLRRGRMHWAALELLRSQADSQPALARDPDVLARHAILGASTETARAAIEYVLTAARRRTTQRNRAECVRLLHAAVELHELAGDTAEHAEYADRVALLDTRCALVTALAYDNLHREARAERARAVTLAETLGSPRLRTKALTCWRAPVIWAIREWRTPDHRVRQALSRALAPYGIAYPAASWTTESDVETPSARRSAPEHGGEATFERGRFPAAAAEMAATARQSTGPGSAPGQSIRSGGGSGSAQGQGARRVGTVGSTPGASARAGSEIGSATGWPGETVGEIHYAPDQFVPEMDLSGHRLRASAADWGAAEGLSLEELVRLLIAATFEAGLEEYEAGQRLAREALKLARTLGDTELFCAAVNAVTYLEYDYGVDFFALIAELELVAAGAGLAEYQAVAHYMGYRAAVARSDLREAGRLAAQAVELADEGQLQPLLDLVSCFAASLELLRGEVEPAERLYEQFGRRITRSGIANAAEAKLFCALAIGWARADLSVLVGRLGETYTLLPGTFGQAYALALVHAGDLDRARAVYAETAGVREEMYPMLMSALRAHTAIALGETDDIAALYEYLLPHSGAIIGSETSMASFGPVDAVLATLAQALGDTAAAAAHRERARRQLERIRTELPIAGNSLLRLA